MDGAYAHNRIYARRLIFDTIDWLDNGVFDGRIDLSKYPKAAAWIPLGAKLASNQPDNAVT